MLRHLRRFVSVTRLFALAFGFCYGVPFVGSIECRCPGVKIALLSHVRSMYACVLFAVTPAAGCEVCSVFFPLFRSPSIAVAFLASA